AGLARQRFDVVASPRRGADETMAELRRGELDVSALLEHLERTHDAGPILAHVCGDRIGVEREPRPAALRMAKEVADERRVLSRELRDDGIELELPLRPKLVAGVIRRR